jgi:hypothetical protein
MSITPLGITGAVVSLNVVEKVPFRDFTVLGIGDIEVIEDA